MTSGFASRRAREYPKCVDAALRPTMPPSPGPCAARSPVVWQTAQRCSKIHRPDSAASPSGDGCAEQRKASDGRQSSHHASAALVAEGLYRNRIAADDGRDVEVRIRGGHFVDPLANQRRDRDMRVDAVKGAQREVEVLA